MISENEEAERILYPNFYRQEEGIHLPALVLDWLGQKGGRGGGSASAWPLRTGNS